MAILNKYCHVISLVTCRVAQKSKPLSRIIIKSY